MLGIGEQCVEADDEGGIARGGTARLQGANGLAARAGHVVRKAAQVVGKGRCGCFTAATMVWTAQGMVPISEIEVGHYVYAAQEDAQASDYAPGEVGDTIYLGEASLVKLTVRHEDGSFEVIETTDEHPFHPVHTGEWTRADQLQIGDLLSAMHGTAELVAVEYGTDRVPVYNLSIPESPTYFVGDYGVWVHNTFCKLNKHHLTPRRFRQQFRMAGINVDDYIQLISEDLHKQIHRGGRRGGSWNAMWESFWEFYPNPSPGNPSRGVVEQQINLMKAIFGLTPQ